MATGIRVTYGAVTNTRGARYIVTNMQNGRRRFVAPDYSATSDNMARNAAESIFGPVEYIGTIGDAVFYVSLKD